MPTVRPATTDDVPALARVINAAYAVEEFFLEGKRTSERELRDKLAAPGAGFLVIEGRTPGALAGAVFVERRGSHGYFGLLAVDPAHQGEGLGRVLVEAAEAHFRAAGCTALDIDVVNLRLELPAFYAKFGFEPVGTAQFHTTEKLKRPAHLVVMRKRIAILLLLAVAGPLLAQRPDTAKVRSAPDSALMTPAILDQGRQLFHGRGSCFACHGAQLQGGPIAPPLKGAKWLHIDGSYESIIHRIDEGKPGTAMVPHPGGITEAQVLMVATYVYAVSHGLAQP